MMRQERAKQFMAFDAMKGLQEALRERERRHEAEERRELAEEQIEKNSRVLLRLCKGTRVRVECYADFRTAVKSGKVSAVSPEFKFLVLGEEKIFFDDIYKITIVP